MSEDENIPIIYKKPGREILKKILSRAFNLETAIYGGNPEEIGNIRNGYKELVIEAMRNNIDKNQIAMVETAGRLKAAIEAGNSDMEKFYRDSLRDLRKEHLAKSYSNN